MDVLRDVPLYFYTVNILREANPPPKHMIVASVTNEPTYIVHTKSDESDTIPKSRLHNTAHADIG